MTADRSSPDCYRNLPRHLLKRRYRTRLVPQARHPPARIPVAHDRESTARTHGVRTLYLRERRPLEARQRTQLPADLGGSGPHGLLAVFVVVTTSLERTARLLGAPEATTSHALATTTTSMPQPSKAESGTLPKTGSKRRKSSNTDPQNRALEQPHHHPHDRADHSGDPLHAARLRILHGLLVHRH